MRWILLLLVCVGAVACNRSEVSTPNEAVRLELTQAEVNLLRASAMEAARRENYDMGRADLRLDREGEHFKGFFTQKAKDALGGELHVIMDKSGRILCVCHGA
jgi:hypothetical protein